MFCSSQPTSSTKSPSDLYPILRAHLERGPLYKPRFHGSHSSCSGSGSDTESEDGGRLSVGSGSGPGSFDDAETTAIDVLLHGFTSKRSKTSRHGHIHRHHNHKSKHTQTQAVLPEEEKVCLLEIHTGCLNPHEINVIIEDGLLIIEGNREEVSPCHGSSFNSFEFTKSFLLPPHCDVDSLCRIDSSGILRIIYNLPPAAIPLETVRPFTSVVNLDEETTCTPHNFQVYIGLYEYAPNEIAVRVEDGILLVEAMKETPVNDGQYEGKNLRVMQSIKRRYLLPHNVVSNEVFCTINGRRGLTVTLLRKGHENDTFIETERGYICSCKEGKYDLEKFGACSL